MHAYTTTQALVTILVIAAVTFFTRAFAFLMFGRKGNPPGDVLYLGKVLPPAKNDKLVV